MSHADELRGEYVTPCDPALSAEELRRALDAGDVPVAVYGLGKLGLPVAAVFAELTGAVTGVDVDPDVASAVQSGECPVPEEPGLSELVADLVADGDLTASTDPPEDAGIHVVVVPTLLSDGEPDLSALRSALRSIGRVISPGDLVVLESTVPPGTTRWLARPILAATGGLDDETFGVAFCPERTQSGRALRDVRGAYPRVVGGVDGRSTRVARLVYEELTAGEVVTTADATTAECVKLFEGVYRDVNIGLANELSRLADDLGIDVREAIDAANTQPFCDIHEPGPGVGGHCIPYYPYFLTDVVATKAPILERARTVNEGMPAHTVDRLAELLTAEDVPVGDATVAVLGVTYRPGVPETRESPALDVGQILTTLGAEVCGVDPLLDRIDTGDVEMPLVSPERFRELAPELDAAVLVTPHEEFELLDWAGIDRMVVLDGRDALDLSGTHHRYHTLGDGGR